MNRPPLEVADLIRAAGDAFIERSRKWITWQHVKVLLAIERCRTAALGGHRRSMLPLRTSCHLLQLVQKSALPEVSGRRSRSMARSAPQGTSANALRPCGLHPSPPAGTAGLAEQEGYLRSPVSHQCGNPAGNRARSPASGRRDRLLQRAAYLGSKSRIEPSLMMPGITISFVFSE